MQKIQTHKIQCDVAVIGGGTAGLNTAIGAAEKGADVLVVDKAPIERSGAIAGGIDHFMAYLESGEPWDTREAYLQYAARVAKGTVNLKVQEKVFCDELFPALERMEKIFGNSLRLKGRSELYRTQSMGQPGPYWINFDGKKLKPKMAKAVRRAGCRVLDSVQVTNLFLHQGELAGFTGFHIRTGDFYQVQAKAVVISTGSANRMFKAQGDNPFNLWYCPACTGDLHRAAYDVGVEMANVEFIRMTIVPKGLSAPGFNAFFGMGSKLVNALGEEFMENYHPMGIKAPRNWIVWATMMEIKEGRSPIFIDCSHLTRTEREHLFGTLGVDKDTLPEFLAAKGYLEEGTRIEVTLSEPMNARPGEMVGSGVKIDENCASNIPGIFAAGDSSDQMGCLHVCTTGGYLAGKNAALYAQQTTAFRDLSAKAMTEERKRVFRPLENEQGLNPRELEDTVRDIATANFGPIKSAQSLTTAIEKLDRLDSVLPTLRAANLHELLRCHEAINIQQWAKVPAYASLARRESRTIPYHYRVDYPETNDGEFCGLIVVRRGERGEATTRFEAIDYSAYL
ncbi:MAG: FAD-dependent oxidoreductase [bacterium]